MLRRSFFGAVLGAPFAVKAVLNKADMKALDVAPSMPWDLPPLKPMQRALGRHRSDEENDYWARNAPRDDMPYWIREKKSWSSAFRGHVHSEEVRRRRDEERAFDNMTFDEQLQRVLDMGVNLEKYVMRSDRGHEHGED